MRKIFECSICKDKTDDPKEYTYPISELANPYECEEFWICEMCNLDLIDEKQQYKHEDIF